MKNVGTTDRLVRLILGLGMVFGGIANSGGIGCPIVIIGLVITYTGMAGRCPFYTWQDINTCSITKAGN